MAESAVVKFEKFRGTFSSWDSLFEKAAAFATKLGRENVISIAHSADHSDGVVTVWYWDGSRRAG